MAPGAPESAVCAPPRMPVRTHVPGPSGRRSGVRGDNRACVTTRTGEYSGAILPRQRLGEPADPAPVHSRCHNPRRMGGEPGPAGARDDRDADGRAQGVRPGVADHGAFRPLVRGDGRNGPHRRGGESAPDQPRGPEGEHGDGRRSGPYVGEVDEMSGSGDHDAGEDPVDGPVLEQRTGGEPGSPDPEEFHGAAGDLAVAQRGQMGAEPAARIVGPGEVVVRTAAPGGQHCKRGSRPGAGRQRKDGCSGGGSERGGRPGVQIDGAARVVGALPPVVRPGPKRPVDPTGDPGGDGTGDNPADHCSHRGQATNPAPDRSTGAPGPGAPGRRAAATRPPAPRPAAPRHAPGPSPSPPAPQASGTVPVPAPRPPGP